MSSKQLHLKPIALAFALAATTGGAAYADDSSMSMWTGDSYAYFNGLDYNPGKFNTARVQPGDEHAHVAVLQKRASPARRGSFATSRSTATVKSPFRDDTGD